MGERDPWWGPGGGRGRLRSFQRIASSCREGVYCKQAGDISGGKRQGFWGLPGGRSRVERSCASAARGLHSWTRGATWVAALAAVRALQRIESLVTTCMGAG